MARDGFSGIADRLAEIGHRFYTRGWVMGTSGNFSAVVSREPFRLAITASSAHKGSFVPGDILQCDERGAAVGRQRRHAVGRNAAAPRDCPRRGAGAVLHTHSVWTTMLSDLHSAAGGFAIEGYEMLKGLHGVAVARTPRMDSDRRQRSGHAPAARDASARRWTASPEAHAFLLVPPRSVYVGRDAGGRRAARRDSRVPVRNDRPDASDGIWRVELEWMRTDRFSNSMSEVTMALVRIPEENRR